MHLIDQYASISIRYAIWVIPWLCVTDVSRTTSARISYCAQGRALALEEHAGSVPTPPLNTFVEYGLLPGNGVLYSLVGAISEDIAAVEEERSRVVS